MYHYNSVNDHQNTASGSYGTPTPYPPQQYPNDYQSSQGYQTLRPPPHETGDLIHHNSISHTSSHGSSDSGYFTRAPSVANPPPYQSYPVQSYPTRMNRAESYARSRQQSQQSSSYSYGHQSRPENEGFRAAPTSSSKNNNERRLDTSSPSSPSEYPCLYPNCGHISSRAHDLKRHITVHCPPAVNEELLDCKYKWCGRTGTHGFKREDHRKEHYPITAETPQIQGGSVASRRLKAMKIHMKDSEYPKTRKGERSKKRDILIERRVVASTKGNIPLQIKKPDSSTYAASEQGPPLSGKTQTSELSTRDVARLGNLQPPKIHENPPNKKSAGLKVSVPDSETVMQEALDINNVGPIDLTATASDGVEIESDEPVEFSPSSDDESVDQQLEDGILDGLGARVACEHKHPTETVLDGNETLISSMSRDTTKDKLATIRSQVLETLLANKAGQYCASLNFHWDILGFMEDQFRENDFPNAALAPVVTITGSAKYAQATTCSEYIKQHWPAHGSNILDALQDALDSPNHTSQSKIVARSDGGSFSNDDTPSSHAELEFDVTHEHLTLCIRSSSGNPDIIVDVVQQLVWMGAALRTSSDGRVQYCEPKLEAVLGVKGVEMATFNITFDTSSPGEEDQSCWFPLFTNPVIAHGFPTARRNHNEVGLEIPLDMMAALGGARHAVDFEGGLLLKGYSALFVPIKRHECSVQWHLIRASGEDRISYHEASVQCPNRALLEDLNHEALSTTRTYLGWWPHAETHLGTADADYKSIDWSHAGGTKRPTRLSGANIGFQTIVTGQFNFTPGAKDGNLHFSHKRPFQRIVQLAQDTSVTLYDLEDRRAWLVPALDVMLHIIQTRHHLSPYKVSGENIELTPVSPENGRGAAKEAVAANHLRQLYERDVAAEKDYYFKDTILDIWSQIDGLMEKEDSIEESSGLALHGTMQSKLCGWEFMSLVHEKNFRRKEVNIAKTSGGWVDLINDIDGLVLFANGFREIIRPTSDIDNLCRRWKSLPTEKDYLAAGVPLLELLYSEAGSRLSRKHLSSNRLQWNRGPTLFERCRDTPSLRCECDRTQQIYHDSLYKTFGRVTPPGILQPNGCVVFGQAHHPFKPPKTIAVRHNAVHTLPNTSIHNGENTKQISTKNNSLLSLSPPASVSPEREVNGYAIQSPKKPPSPLSLSDDLAEGETVAPKRRRKLSHVQRSNPEACEEPSNRDDQILLSDDCATCPVKHQSTPRHDTVANRQYLGPTQTACATEAEYEPVLARRTIRRKAKIEDYSHLYGCSCTICSTVSFEPPDSIELHSSTNGTRGNTMSMAERRERQAV